MKKLSLLKLPKIVARSNHPHPQNEAGFTLLEVLVVVLLIGIIAAIMGPSWFGFISQRRASAAGDAVLNAVQQAQSEAKKAKRSYSVSVRTLTDKVPEIAVHQGTTIPDANSPLWKSIGEGLEIKPGQIWLGTNVTANNTDGTITIDNNLDTVTGAVKAATFDYTGTLQSQNAGLIISVAAAQPNNPSNPIPRTGRCVTIRTLIGSIQRGKTDPTAATAECK